ncbi:MAG TPA: aminomethyltransferase family protein, partial [Candidatus Binatus sp.]|nr:aminomethyltransferase family protein [Candidatus Binatus sp.]
VAVEDVSESIAAIALQGPFARAVLEAAVGESLAELRYFRRRDATIAGVPVGISRTGYTGDLGYEIWIPAADAPKAWDALWSAGRPYGVRAAGMLALDVVRLEAGLVLIEVDYTSARHALNPEQSYSPFEIGMGRLVDLEAAPFVGQLALRREAAQASSRATRRLVGVSLDWSGIEALYSAQALPPAISPVVSRAAAPVFAPGGLRGDRQVGKVTSLGWSPILKQAIGLASVPAAYEAPGSKLAVEWTVEGRRGRVAATVVPLPFLDLPRKRA